MTETKPQPVAHLESESSAIDHTPIYHIRIDRNLKAGTLLTWDKAGANLTREVSRGTLQRVVTIELAHQDAVRIAKKLPYAKVGDTVTATAPDGTGITIEIRPNKKP